jgi:dynein heavy chain, axonemal
MTMMFEVADLAVASPATISRCGMVYLEPSILGLKPFVECWIRRLPDNLLIHREALNRLFDAFLEVDSLLVLQFEKFFKNIKFLLDNF